MNFLYFDLYSIFTMLMKYTTFISRFNIYMYVACTDQSLTSHLFKATAPDWIINLESHLAVNKL